jgi:hypothetical protein
MTETRPLKIVAAILDRQELLLYEDNGNTHIIPQGDPRLAGMVATIIPEIRSKAYAMVTLEFDDIPVNVFKEYEQKTGGLTRFFRVARATLKNIFSNRHQAEENQVVLAAGTIPNPVAAKPAAIPVMAISDQQVVDEIIANARPANTPKFTDKISASTDIDKAEGETIVAITGNKVVPNVQNIERHIAQANETNTVGMQRFLERMASMHSKRAHSVEDLLQFMKHGDLPIADDGSIIIYKVLKKHTQPGHYVDIHSKKVIQRVGSRVFMSEKLVDPSRHHDCSDGLHVAQRSYLNGFNGDVCILGRIHPEDVIAVPKYATNKMRVCSYEILAELSPQAHSKLNNNQNFGNLPRDMALLTMAVRGEFPCYNQLVEITEPMGGGLKITDLPENQASRPASQEPATAPEQVAPLPDTLPEDVQAPPAPMVAPKDVQAAIEEDKKVMPPTRSQVAQDMWNQYCLDPTKEKAEALISFKRKAKVSWFSLGFTTSPEETLRTKIEG